MKKKTFKYYLIFLFCVAAVSTILSSCNLEQSILKDGCQVHEFAYYTTSTNTDSTGIYIVCDNKTLVKKFPKVAAKTISILKLK